MIYSCLHEKTPIEKYAVAGHEIYVKRDDLFGTYPAPNLAKLRGARILLANLKEQGIKKVGVYDTTVSKAGQGAAYVCKELGLECLLGFPLLIGTQPAESKLIAEELGAKLYPLKAGRTAITYYRFKKIVEAQEGYMLPLGLTCPETVEALRCLSATIDGKFNSIVLVTGTGTIATGLALGTNAAVYGVSCGMSVIKQRKRINDLAYIYKLDNLRIDNLQLISPKYGYYDALDTSSCPFPTSPYYDMKAWEWLVENIEWLEEPVLFWNIGV